MSLKIKLANNTVIDMMPSLNSIHMSITDFESKKQLGEIIMHEYKIEKQRNIRNKLFAKSFDKVSFESFIEECKYIAKDAKISISIKYNY